MNFEACLQLPHDPREAAVIADNLEALARALHEWPVEAWAKLAASAEEESSRTPDGLFERLAQRTATAATDPNHRVTAARSAEAVAAVLRVLWPEARREQAEPAPQATEPVAATA